MKDWKMVLDDLILNGMFVIDNYTIKKKEGGIIFKESFSCPRNNWL